MKTSIIKFGITGLFLLTAVALIAVTTVTAQTATSTATSSEAVVDAAPSTSTPEAVATPTAEEAVGEAPVAESEILTEVLMSPETASVAVEVTPVEPAPEGLTKVTIIGTKYVDYFTDGTSEFSFPGDPAIDAHLGEKDATIPTHEGLTWVHTSGQHLYDTASGDLEEGQYALQSNGTYIARSLPFVSSTSTPAVLDASTTPAEPAPKANASTSPSFEVPPVPEQSPVDTEASTTTQ